MSSATTEKVPCPGWTENGNAFAIMGSVARCMERAGRSPDEIRQYRNDATSGDYDNLLRVTMAVVDDDPLMEMREAYDTLEGDE